MNPGLNYAIKGLLYSLGREYGGEIMLYKRGETTSNLQTGERTVEFTAYHVPSAIILPAKVAYEQVRGISLISANKQVVMGGWFNNAVRIFVIDREWLPDVELSKSDWIRYQNRRYDIHDFQEFEYDNAWIIEGHAVEGESPAVTHNVALTETVSVNTDAVGS